MVWMATMNMGSPMVVKKEGLTVTPNTTPKKTTKP
jgi:hypothetical protein